MADTEARNAYEGARKKLIEALNKKRAADKALVSLWSHAVLLGAC